MSENQFELSRVSGQPVSDQELIIDLIRVAKLLQMETVPQKKYRDLGNFDDSTVIRRFGTWNNGLIKSGLTISNEISISDERLFENLLNLWEKHGRQPRRSELAFSPSEFSQTPYNRRFGSWTSALEAFIKYANTANFDSPSAEVEQNSTKRKTGRDPSLRLRWHVLKRDKFKCCACGSSPAIDPKVELHVDHILAWSNGGETVLENLQTLCLKCNLGKSNINV